MMLLMVKVAEVLSTFVLKILFVTDECGLVPIH